MADLRTRLQDALESRGMSMRELHLALTRHGQDERGGKLVIGTAYTTVRDYLNGKSEPSVTWVRAVARLLDVEEIWLLTGREAPTPAHESEGFAAAAGGYHLTWSDTPERVYELETWLAEGLGSWLPWSWPGSVGLVHVARRWYTRRWVAGQATGDERDFNRDVAVRVGGAARAPLEALGVDPRALSDAQLNLYLLGMVPVLALLSEMYTDGSEDS